MWLWAEYPPHLPCHTLNTHRCDLRAGWKGSIATLPTHAISVYMPETSARDPYSSTCRAAEGVSSPISARIALEIVWLRLIVERHRVRHRLHYPAARVLLLTESRGAQLERQLRRRPVIQMCSAILLIAAGALLLTALFV